MVSSIFYFHSYFEKISDLTIWYFSNGLVQPPTRYIMPWFFFHHLDTLVCCYHLWPPSTSLLSGFHPMRLNQEASPRGKVGSVEIRKRRHEKMPQNTGDWGWLGSLDGKVKMVLDWNSVNISLIGPIYGILAHVCYEKQPFYIGKYASPILLEHWNHRLRWTSRPVERQQLGSEGRSITLHLGVPRCFFSQIYPSCHNHRSWKWVPPIVV